MRNIENNFVYVFVFVFIYKENHVHDHRVTVIISTAVEVADVEAVAQIVIMTENIVDSSINSHL